MIRPLGDRILVRPTPPPDRTESGLHLVVGTPQQADGEVVAVGTGRILPDRSREPIDVSAGDRVIFPRFTGTEVEVGGEKLLLLSQRDVLVRA